MISVIVVTYNQEQTIGRCLDAIMNQPSTEPIEVLVGDDCSCDNTPQVCMDYGNRYPDQVRVFLRKHNLGLVENYYSLIREAKGDYIIDCAGDDEWCPDRLSVCLDIMKRYPNVVHVVTDAWNRCDSDGSLTESHAARYPEGVISGRDMIHDVLTRQKQQIFLGMMRTRAVHDTMSAYPQFFSGRTYPLEDKQIITLLGLHGDTYYTSRKTFYYTIDNTSSIMHTDDAMKRFRFYGRLFSLTYALAQTLHYSCWQMLPMYGFLLSLRWRQPLRWISAKIFSH